MTARVLEYEEWSKLPDYLDPVLVNLRPGSSRVCVVENEQGEIVARWLLYPMLLAEDIWVHPDYRKQPSVGRRLLTLAHRCAKELGFSQMVSAVLDDDVRRLLAHPSVQAETLPQMFVFPVKEAI